MIDEHIESLIDRDVGRSLDRLESDIWTGALSRCNERRKATLLALLQGGVLVFALVASVATGLSVANATVQSNPLAADIQLTPSMRLFGDHP